MRAGTEDKLESASFPEEEKGIRRRKISSKSAEDRETDKKKILNTTNEEKEKDKTESSSTPYDDVFKTLLNDCTFLILLFLPVNNNDIVEGRNPSYVFQ